MASKEVNEQVKPIIIHDTESGTDYTLEFDRDSVRFAESRGFDIDEVSKFPLTKIPELFYYAFRMHHKSISREKTDRILFDDLGGLPEGAAERLGALYAAPYEALSSKGDKKAKNPKMTMEL